MDGAHFNLLRLNKLSLSYILPITIKAKDSELFFFFKKKRKPVMSWNKK